MMDEAEEAARFRTVMDAGSNGAAEISPLNPGTARASRLLRAVGGPDPVLQMGARASRGELGDDARRRVIELLQQCAYEAALVGRGPGWLAPMEMLIQLCPDDLGCKVQVALTLKEVGRLWDVIPIVEPYLAPFLGDVESHRPFLSVVVEAAYLLARIDLIEMMLPSLGVFSGMSVLAQTICRRVAFLQRAGLGPEQTTATTAEAELRSAAFLLDEISQIAALSALEGRFARGSQEGLRLALILAGAAWRERWALAYRRALTLAAQCLVSGLEAFAQACWTSADLPQPAFEPLLIAAGLSTTEPADARRAFEAAFSAFHADPCLQTARSMWSTAYACGKFAQLIHIAPVSEDPGSSWERARAFATLGVPEVSDADLWVFMTWRTDSDRLLQTLAAYVGEATVVVGVGGDANPSAFARATTALLARKLHLLARPIVTWGDQRCMFHNLFEVLSAFRSRSSQDGWMQIVCDRTYPLKSMAGLKAWTTSGRITPTLLGPNAWNMEWPAETVDNLPSIYDGAINEAFERGFPEQFQTLATKSVFYGDNDSRLQVNVFNFSDKPCRITWDPRTSWHGYYVSAFEADVRWMSFARLQEYVDVGTETMSTFVRRLHPTTMRWAHKVLCKYDLRTGDPWVYVSRRYADRVMDDPGFDELFSVMNMGFAPEMNYLDTVAATFKLENDFFHHFQVLPGEAAIDSLLPMTCEGVDSRGRAFVRKTDPVAGKQLIGFFADRILEDHLASGVHWTVASGPFASDQEEPRPRLDEALMSRFIGAPVQIRDLLRRKALECCFQQGFILLEADQSLVASWRVEDGGLTVQFRDPALGVKRYERAAGDAEWLTLAPAELIGAHNQWSAVLDFALADMNIAGEAQMIGLGQGQSVLVQPAQWTGAGTSDAAILCAFADPERSALPTPTMTVPGGVYRIRQVNGALLALCSVDGMPALMEVCGSAQAGQRTAVHMTLASERQADQWEDGVDSSLVDHLPRPAIPGPWTLDLMEGRQIVQLGDDNWIYSQDREPVGRWFLRPDGLQVLGLSEVRMGLANHFRLDRGRWTLSGWGWRNMKDAVTFHLEQIDHDPQRIAPAHESIQPEHPQSEHV